MRSHPHNALHLDVGFSPPPSPNAMEVRRAFSCRFNGRYLGRPRESGYGDIQGRERCSSRAQNPNTAARARRTTRNPSLIFL